MRQITRQAVNAFYKYENFSLSNTQVRVENGVSKMYLHGNLIATYDEYGAVSISSAGWETTTTKERLNGVLYRHPHINKFKIKQIKGTWYILNILNEKTSPFKGFTSFNFKTF